MLSQLILDLNQLQNSSKAKILSGFFKTAPGQYGEGDIFLGITVPQQRQIAKKYLLISLDDIQTLLHSPIHEQRLTALIILTEQYKKATSDQQHQIYHFYLKNAQHINNWDLVDGSAPYIPGQYLLHKPKDILYQLAQSNNLWEKRIAIVSTFAFIRNNQFQPTLDISKILIHDQHDLIHKAIGWMLREVGKRNQALLEKFLNWNLKHLPRTTLRYAIEKFPTEKRRYYLKK